MDVHNQNQRSRNMRAIKSRGTKCEVLLAKAMWADGLRYRKNDKTVFGKPDFTFKGKKVAVFVDSEFFHGKDFDTKKKPATNAGFWEKKILGNMKRDRVVNEKLESEGWRVLRFWSREVERDADSVTAAISLQLKNRF